MKKKIVGVFCFMVFALSVKSQNFKSLDVALAKGSGSTSVALGLEKMYGIGKNEKIKIGYGIRYTGFWGNKLDFRTAPASLTSGKASIVALFSDDIVSQIDTFKIQNVQTNAINLNIRLAYNLTKKMEVGFNIDAAGFTFGKNTSGVLQAIDSDNTGEANHNKSFSAKPTAFNLLLISDSDLGSLNSELYLRYWASEKFGIRVGGSFQFVEYTANQNLAFDNDRFRSKQLIPFLALTIKL
jgi:hypothetical protein